MANDVQQRTASSGYYSLYANAAERVDSMLGDPSTSITQAMDSFFASAEAVANSPTSLPERQVMLSNAETLVQRFDYIVGRVDDVTKEMNSQIAGAVSEINQLAGGIATLNDEIAKVSGRTAVYPTIYWISATRSLCSSVVWWIPRPWPKTTAHSTCLLAAVSPW